MKNLIKLFFVVVFFITLYFISAPGKNVACAKYYGTSDLCPRDNNPVSTYYSSGISSIDINIEIRGNNIPPTQVFKVDADSAECSEVKCLKRSEHGVQSSPYDGNIATATIQTIGCSTNCDDNLIVNAYFGSNPGGLVCKVYAGTSTGGVYLGTSAQQSDSIRGRNGTQMTFQFYFDCSSPPTLPPTPTPTHTPTPSPTGAVTPTIPPSPFPSVTVTPTTVPTTNPTPTTTPANPTIVCEYPAIPVVRISCSGCNPSPIPTPTGSKKNGAQCNYDSECTSGHCVMSGNGKLCSNQ